MKVTTYGWLCAMIFFFSSCGMQNSKTLRIPLNEGVNNKYFYFRTLEIQPVSFNRAPQTQYQPWLLELILSSDSSGYATLLAYYPLEAELKNFPLAFREYFLRLEPSAGGSDPAFDLVVEPTEFGREFLLGWQQEAIFDGLTVRFDDVTYEKAQFEPDGPIVDGAVYCLTLSDGEQEEKKIEFTSYELDGKGTLTFPWEGYLISVLSHHEQALQLKIDRQ